MSLLVSVKGAERKSLALLLEDGLLDIAIGLFFIVWYVAPLIELSLPLSGFLTLILWAPIPYLYFRMRRGISQPRIGIVKLTSIQRSRFYLLALASVLFVLSPLLMQTFSRLQNPEYHFYQFYTPSPIFGIGMLCFIYLAYISGLKRFIVYGVLYLLLLPPSFMWSFRIIWHVESWFIVPIFVSLQNLGVIILGCGLVLLHRFMAKHKPHETDDLELKNA